jgi:uncharacterized repeat protein (TIGR01451 family)
MAKRFVGSRAFVVAGLLVGFLGMATSAPAVELGDQAVRQLRAIFAEKASRTPAQRKLATSLLYANRESRGLAMVQGLPPQRRVVNRAAVEPDGMVVVDIRGEVSDALLQAIAGVGGRVVVALPNRRSVRARVPVRRLESLAELPEVRFIAPRQRSLVNTVTTQGDVAHAAASVRSTYGIDGTGVKVGVLSDGVDSLAARQSATELPATCLPSPGPEACVTVVPGQAGSGDEGTAILEIVHDIAPGAKLYFATGTDATTLDSGFAQNILKLKNEYGCDIILDDITYLDEGAFQDGVIAQAVSTVKAAGVLYFSSAGNSGRKDAGTSGTWEGDYLNSGTSIAYFTGWDWEGKEIHSWNGASGAGAVNANALTAEAPYAISLKWSDPLGAAVTDYDLFLFEPDMSYIWDYSADVQDCAESDPYCSVDPYEEMGFGYTGEKVVVVRWSGPAKALRLDTYRGRLTESTAGATFGHNAAESAITVAAAGVASASGGAFTGGTTNPVESYSSDGPRRMFYAADGTAITPGNVLFATAGGRELQKPDLTAADCVATAFAAGGYNPFCGTSAAAPHAAGIAALLLSTSPAPTPAAVAAAMASTALDVLPGAGWDRNSGAGIVMADRPQTAADLSVAMTGPAGVGRGADGVYTVTVTHNGPGSASSAEVADATPPGLVFVSNSGDCTTPFPCLLGPLATGETRTITSTFTIPPGYSGPSPFTNTATVSSSTPDPIAANDSSGVATAVGDADLSIGKTGPLSAIRGTDVVYTVTVSNGGPDDAVSTAVSDTTPAGLTFVSTGGDCTTAFPCALGTVPVGATRTITARYHVPSDYSGPSPLSNTATVSSALPDAAGGNNSATAETAIVNGADLSITNAGPAFATRAAEITYTIVVANAGADAASSVEVADPTPAGLTFVSNAGACTAAFPCSLGTLAAGETRTITATFSVPADQDVSAPIVNTATVSSAVPDPDGSNDSATATSLFGGFYTLAPCRIVDTRAAQTPALTPGQERTFVLAGPPCGVPIGAAALSLNLAVTSPTAPGNVRLYPADVAVAPTVSSLNFSAGQTRTNNAIVRAAADGTVAIKVKNASAGTVHVVLDVNGYFE